MSVRTIADDAFHEAQAYYNAGNYRRCRELVMQSLAQFPDDVNLLRLAGRCSLALGLDDAAMYLQRVVNMRPDDVQAWHDLGDALVDDGRLSEAAAALREAIRLHPNDVGALVDLGHTLYVTGEIDEAVSYLARAAQLEHGNLNILRSLVDMYRHAGRLQEALDTAAQITNLRPEDVLATMDVADLNLELGNLDEAVAAYSRLKRIDAEEEHEVYAYHGMIQAEMERERWRRALDLAVDATRIDRYGLTTDLLAFAVVQVFGASDRPAPTRAEVEAALAAERAEHRRLHTEELAL